MDHGMIWDLEKLKLISKKQLFIFTHEYFRN